MTNLDSMLKSRDIALPTKVHIVKAMVFPVVLYWCVSWTIKKPERWRIDVFELWCWRRLLRVPWTAKRSNQSILREISPEYSLERLMLKLKFQYFGHLMWRIDSLEKTLMLGGIEGRRRRGWQRTRWLDGVTHSIAMNLSKLWEMVMDREVGGAAVHGVAKRRTRLSDWAHTPTISRSLLKFMSIELVMPSNYILCLPLLLLPSIFPSIKVFSDELALHIRWPKYWSFSFSISLSNEYPGLISFRIDWFDLHAVQGTL